MYEKDKLTKIQSSHCCSVVECLPSICKSSNPQYRRKKEEIKEEGRKEKGERGKEGKKSSKIKMAILS